MSATDALNFACECGKVTGLIDHATPEQGDYVVCHCTDCQDLVRHFGKEERLLDSHAGTALYQSRCARLQIATGLKQLAGLHMTDGPTLRWYAACCGTPMFNTYKNARVPYITTLLGNCDAGGRKRLGEPLGHLFLDEGVGETAPLRPLSMNRLLRRFLPRMIKDILSRDRRRQPLFEHDSLEPIITPRRLTEEERKALDQK